MVYRVPTFDGVMLLLWGLLYFLNAGILHFDLGIACLGVVAGLLIGAPVYLKQLKIIEEKGEFKTTLKIVAWTLLTAIAVISVFLYLIYSFLGLGVALPMFNFISPLLPALYASRIIFFLRWEKKHKMLIMWDGLIRTRLYAVSKGAIR